MKHTYDAGKGKTFDAGDLYEMLVNLPARTDVIIRSRMNGKPYRVEYDDEGFGEAAQRVECEVPPPSWSEPPLPVDVGDAETSAGAPGGNHTPDGSAPLSGAPTGREPGQRFRAAVTGRSVADVIDHEIPKAAEQLGGLVVGARTDKPEGERRGHYVVEGGRWVEVSEGEPRPRRPWDPPKVEAERIDEPGEARFRLRLTATTVTPTDDELREWAASLPEHNSSTEAMLAGHELYRTPEGSIVRLQGSTALGFRNDVGGKAEK